jgi:quercetin dioxygenase-like cupin family protein
VEIVRFGPGHRRVGGPAGSLGLADQVLWSDDRAHVSELAFTRQAIMPPLTSPHDGVFIIVSGGGWVQVGEERLAVHHGEAVSWPAGVSHGAWTDGSEMRALLVELPGEGRSGGRLGTGEGIASAPASNRPVEPARGGLAPRQGSPVDHDPTEGEPW